MIALYYGLSSNIRKKVTNLNCNIKAMAKLASLLLPLASFIPLVTPEVFSSILKEFPTNIYSIFGNINMRRVIINLRMANIKIS